MIESSFVGANFREASLHWALLKNSDCCEANFSHCDLRMADLRRTTLEDADWYGALIDDWTVRHSCWAEEMVASLQGRGAILAETLAFKLERYTKSGGEGVIARLARRWDPSKENAEVAMATYERAAAAQDFMIGNDPEHHAVPAICRDHGVLAALVALAIQRSTGLNSSACYTRRWGRIIGAAIRVE